MTEWQPKTKPPPNVCPRNLCWHWVSEGSSIAPGAYVSKEEAFHCVLPVLQPGCAWSEGTCSRVDPVTGASCRRPVLAHPGYHWDDLIGSVRDCYEAMEPELEQAGLPWFYFIPGPDHLGDEETRKAYTVASERLWGPKHSEAPE